MDTDTFTDENIINFSKENFISLKINTDTDDGFELFNQFNGISLPTLLFLSPEGHEIDRFIGYYEPLDYFQKINDITNDINTLKYFLSQSQLYPDSNVIALKIGNKYLERNIKDTAKIYFEKVLSGKDKKHHQEANYKLAFLEYENNNLKPILTFIDDNPNSDFTYSALRSIIRYYKGLSDTTSEIIYYEKLINLFPNDPTALNSYGWRMSELEINLEKALEKTELAVNLTSDDPDSQSNIIDTKAEILWKLGKIQDAINVIEKAIKIDPEREYYREQKNKFIKSLKVL